MAHYSTTFHINRQNCQLISVVTLSAGGQDKEKQYCQEVQRFGWTLHHSPVVQKLSFQCGFGRICWVVIHGHFFTNRIASYGVDGIPGKTYAHILVASLDRLSLIRLSVDLIRVYSYWRLRAAAARMTYLYCRCQYGPTGAWPGLGRLPSLIR